MFGLIMRIEVNFLKKLGEEIMKKVVSVALICLAFICCARYNVSNLPSNNVMDYPNREEQDGVAVACKVFDVREIKEIFSGNTLKKGYQPIYLVIDNRSPET